MSIEAAQTTEPADDGFCGARQVLVSLCGTPVCGTAGAPCGHRGYLLAPGVPVSAELRDALHGLLLRSPDRGRDCGDLFSTAQPIDWPALVASPTAGVELDPLAMRTSGAATWESITDAWAVLDVYGANPRLDVCAWWWGPGTIAIFPAMLHADPIGADLSAQITDRLIAGRRPRTAIHPHPTLPGWQTAG